MRKSLLTGFLICLLCITYAQKPEDLLAQWGEKSPIEKIYLHFDREIYIAGEIAWFKAYLSSDYQPDTISTVLYIELVKDSSSVLVKKVLPILFGVTNGQIEIPDSIYSGSYLVRAWTPSQLNQDPEFIFQRQLFIYGKQNPNAYDVPGQMTRLEFFPESGNFISGIQNTIAVKATNERGLPVQFSGVVMNGNDQRVTEFSSVHDGMGMFDLTPTTEQYYVVSASEPGGKKYLLPKATERGVVLSLIPHPQGHFFEIRQKESDPQYKASYMVGQMQHHIVFRQEFKSSRDEMSGVINTGHLRSGIMQVTLFSREGLPLAERLCFVNNREYEQTAQLILDTLSVSAKSRNRFLVQLKDTVVGNFSISISDPDYDLNPVREENIYSRFLLSSDLRGYIHNPAWYFSKDNDTVKTALDLVMMTNGWRRFSWKNIPINQPAVYFDPGFIRLAGKATLRDSKKAFDNKSLLLYFVGSDSAKSYQMTRTDQNGRFSVDSLLFFGVTRVMLSDPRGKKGFFIDANFDADSLRRNFLLPGQAGTPVNRYELVARATQTKIAQDFEIIRNASGEMLAGVTVKARKKNPLFELEERYASGMFSGMSEKILDLTNTKETSTYSNIFDYLQFRVPGLEIGTNADGDYVVYYRQGPSVSSMGEIGMTLFLNETMTDANTIATIQASEVAMIKIYSSFVGATGNGAGGAMAIYTKKGDDLFDFSSGRSFNLRYNGFSVIREFYSPDYQKAPAEKTKEDKRITLQWKPDIMLSGVNPKIPVVFYNNDRTKRYRVVVEGMTVDGKLLMLEKIVF